MLYTNGKEDALMKKDPMDAPAVRAARNARPDPTDPFGSYTGRPLDPAETPVQDADDL